MYEGDEKSILCARNLSRYNLRNKIETWTFRNESFRNSIANCMITSIIRMHNNIEPPIMSIIFLPVIKSIHHFVVFLAIQLLQTIYALTSTSPTSREGTRGPSSCGSPITNSPSHSNSANISSLFTSPYKLISLEGTYIHREKVLPFPIYSTPLCSPIPPDTWRRP